MSDKNGADKKGTIIYNDMLQKCGRMNDAQFGRTMRLILQYAEELQLPDLEKEDPFIATIFEFVRPSVDADREKWEKRKQANIANGKKGGRKKATDNELNPTETHEYPSLNNESEINPKEPVNGKRLSVIGKRSDDKDIPPVGGEPDGSHQSLFDYYLKLGLIAHKSLTPEMKNAIDTARRRGGYTWDDLKTMLDRHACVVDLTKGNGEFAVRPRGLPEFFGQKVKDGTALICSEYADGGAKWELYKDGNPHRPRSDSPKREAFERKVGNYDHLAVDLFEDKAAASGGSGP